MTNAIIQQIEKDQLDKIAAKREVPEFDAGDTVRVHLKVVEGTRERIQQFEGVGVTGGRFQGVFGDLLGNYPHFGGAGNVFLRPVCRGGGQQEVGQCQYDKMARPK